MGTAYVRFSFEWALKEYWKNAHKRNVVDECNGAGRIITCSRANHNLPMRRNPNVTGLKNFAEAFVYQPGMW